MAGRGQTPEKVTATDLFYLRSMHEGTVVNIPYLLHIRLITKESLQRLIVVVHDLRVIDMDELVRLHICERLGDVWAWIAPGPQRQQVVAAGTTQADMEIPEKGV
ncbi:hypothetical protein Tco_0182105 [Tanacetum coccineum]